MPVSLQRSSSSTDQVDYSSSGAAPANAASTTGLPSFSNLLQNLQQATPGTDTDQQTLSALADKPANNGGITNPAVLLAQLRVSTVQAPDDKTVATANTGATKSKKAAEKAAPASAPAIPPAALLTSADIPLLPSAAITPAAPNQNPKTSAADSKPVSGVKTISNSVTAGIAFAVKLTAKPQNAQTMQSGKESDESTENGTAAVSKDAPDNTFSSDMTEAGASAGLKSSIARVTASLASTSAHDVPSDRVASASGVVEFSVGSHSGRSNTAADVSEIGSASGATETGAGSQVKDIQVQVTGNDTRVDLRMIERAGSLSISVRTPDAALTKSLQQNLPELSNKIAELQPLRAEWWTPAAPKIASSEKAEHGSTGNNSSQTSDNSANDSGNSNRRGNRDPRQPDWMDELASQRKSNQNGTNFSWHL